MKPKPRVLENFDPVEAVSMGLPDSERPGLLHEQIEFKQQSQLNGVETQSLIYHAFMEQEFHMKLLTAVHKEFYIPSGLRRVLPA